MPIHVALVGCGKFVRFMHLPILKADSRFRIHGVVDVNRAAAAAVAAECGAAWWTDDVGRALTDPQVQLVFIGTPHHSHADLSARAARAGKHIFCEKPMGLHEAECRMVADAVRQAGVKYTVGYNRSLAPFVRQARAVLAGLHAPMLIHYRMADWNPYRSGWLLDETLSGGRLVGEGCHVFDVLCHLAGQDPVRLYAAGGNFAEPSPTGAPDSAIVTLTFPDGSSGVMFLSSIGNNGHPKEEILITCANYTIVIDNYQTMTIHAPEGRQSVTLPQVDKGHRAELDGLARAILEDTPAPNGVADALRAARCSFAATQSIRAGQIQSF